MATELQEVVTFDDFSKGEWSDLGGIKAQAGQFTAENMIVRANGLIGPRAGLKNITPASMPNGKLLMLEAGPTPLRDGVFIVGNTVYYFDLFNTATAPTSIGTITSTPTVILRPFLATTKFYIAVPGDKSYVIDPVAGSVTALTGSPGGHAIIQYGARLVVAESTSSNRIFISAPSNFNSWPASNFIDIGDSWQVTGFAVQKNHLTIFKREGIYVLTGTPTVNEVIRLADTMQGPLQPWQADIDQDDMIHLISTFGVNPSYFDGSDAQQVNYLKELRGDRDDTDPLPPTKRGVLAIEGELTASTVVFANKNVSGSDRLVVKHNGIWTKHPLDVSVSGMMTTDNGQLVITDGGGTSTPAKIYTTRFDLGRPAFTSDGLASVGDDSSTPLHAEFTLPEWYSPDGTEIAIESVLIDVIKWNTGAEATNHIEMNAVSIGGFARPGKRALASRTWDEAGSSATTGGVSERIQFNVERIQGAGFQLAFDNIRGIDIQSIHVVLSKFPNGPRV